MPEREEVLARLIEALSAHRELSRLLARAHAASDDGRTVTVRVSLNDLAALRAVLSSEEESVSRAASAAFGGPRSIEVSLKAAAKDPRTATARGRVYAEIAARFERRGGEDALRGLGETVGARLEKELSDRVERGPASGAAEGATANGSASAELIVVDGAELGRRFPLDASKVTIGRGPENRIFLSDPTVSKRHARILIRDGQVEVEDLESKNGTRVNGRAVTTSPLLPTDLLSIGTTTFRLSPHSQPGS